MGGFRALSSPPTLTKGIVDLEKLPSILNRRQRVSCRSSYLNTVIGENLRGKTVPVSEGVTTRVIEDNDPSTRVTLQTDNETGSNTLTRSESRWRPQ